jgi:hypothetical protein
MHRRQTLSFIILAVLCAAGLSTLLLARAAPGAPPATAPPVAQAATLAPTRVPATPPPPTSQPTAPPTAAPPTPTTIPPSPTAAPIVVGGRRYDAYIAAATKQHQDYHYSCEFDAAWVIFKTFGQDVAVDAMVEVIGVDARVEPYYVETTDGFVIYGGDIGAHYSGDYTKNFLARSTGAAMRQVFEHFGLAATPIHSRSAVEAALRSGRLIWMKTTVDFKPWRPATWLTPEGDRYRTVLGNDHAVVAIGYSERGVIIRDVLGPTSSNRQRPYEYEVDWARFLAAWEAQSYDGLAVGPA